MAKPNKAPKIKSFMLVKNLITGIAGNFYRHISRDPVNPALCRDDYWACTCILALVDA
jgi:hypothetical protein